MNQHQQKKGTNVGVGATNLLHSYNSRIYGGEEVMNDTIFSYDPYNSRKRLREEDAASLIFAQQQQRQQQQLQLMNSTPYSVDLQQKNATSSKPHVFPFMVSTDLQVYDDNGLQNQSSTCGRSSNCVMPPFGDEMPSQLHQQSEDLDKLVQFQMMLTAVGEKNKTYSRAMISLVEDRMMRKVKEKECEIENACRINAELEERIRQLSFNKQLWQIMAKNNAAVVNTLKSNLEHEVAQCMERRREGFGDSEADNAASCSNAKTLTENKELKMQRSCKVCGRNQVCVLLLPCRHLCLCKECENRIHSCPICSAAKNATVQVYMD